MTSKNIESVLQEERTFPPSAEFASRAQIKPGDLERLSREAAEDASGFWARLAREEITWHTPFTVSLDDSAAPNYRWFTDGRLNVSFNCLDVHLADRGEKPAIIFEGEPGDTRRLSYRELHAEVCRLANALKAQGVGKGDRVAIYMPLVPESIIAMHACNRIGAIHSVVFGGFSAPALKDRIEDTGAKVLITADGGWRGGNAVELKSAADKALAEGCATIERVIVLKRTGRPVSMRRGRDLWWHEVLQGQATACDPEWVEAEHPLYLLYTSGSTGKPKGIQHSSGGFLLGAKLTTQWVFDLRDDDVFWCTADVGWVTGHSYVAYGPLAAGATVMLYEGAPTTPDAGRFWKICQDHGVSVFYTAPTAIRALMKLGEEFPARYDLSRLRLLGSVGEPINPEAWMWYHRVIGRGRCPIVDTWWQTETGVILISPLPGVTPTKPGSCTLPLPGIEADIVDERGESVTRADAGGYLVIKKPWPAMVRTIWGNNARYLAAYWEKFNKRFYVAGDSAHRDKDGYFWIMGRIDDVLNVAGHRLGTMEIESALVSNPRVAEAAVVGKPHEIKGESVFAYVVCRGQRPTGDTSALVSELRAWVAEHLGAIAKPDEIRFADNLPKTRSGKIMRRLLRAIARGEEIAQDVSTLENPGILDQLRGVDAPAAAAKAPPRKSRSASRTRRAAGTKSPGAILDGAKRRARADRRERSATSSASALDSPEGARPRTGRVTAEAQDGPSNRTSSGRSPVGRAKGRARPGRSTAAKSKTNAASSTRRRSKSKSAASALGAKRRGSVAKGAARNARVRSAAKSKAARAPARRAQKSKAVRRPTGRKAREKR